MTGVILTTLAGVALAAPYALVMLDSLWDRQAPPRAVQPAHGAFMTESGCPIIPGRPQ